MKRIRSFFLLAVLAAAASNLSAQSKMVRLHLADGTSKYTSVAGLEKISFLAPDVADRGLTLNLADGSRVGVYFCDEPAITFTDGGFRLSSAALDPVEVSFDNVTDITVGTVAAVESVGSENLMIICELNPGEVLSAASPPASPLRSTPSTGASRPRSPPLPVKSASRAMPSPPASISSKSALTPRKSSSDPPLL